MSTECTVSNMSITAGDFSIGPFSDCVGSLNTGPFGCCNPAPYFQPTWYFPVCYPYPYIMLTADQLKEIVREAVKEALKASRDESRWYPPV